MSSDGADIVRVCAAVVRRSGRILLTTRPDGRHLAGKWEFPGGKIHPGENPGACVVREMKEELGVNVIPLDLIYSVLHEYPTKTVHLEFYRAIPSDSSFDPAPTEGQKFAWVEPARILEYDLLPADLPIAEFLHSSER